MISKYAARRKNRVAANAENIGDGVGWGQYPAESWARADAPTSHQLRRLMTLTAASDKPSGPAVSCKRCSPRSVVYIKLMPIFVGVRRWGGGWCQMRVRSSKIRVFSVDRYIFRMKFPTGFRYRNLHGIARFPGDSTAHRRRRRGGVGGTCPLKFGKKIRAIIM